MQSNQDEIIQIMRLPQSLHADNFWNIWTQSSHMWSTNVVKISYGIKHLRFRWLIDKEIFENYLEPIFFKFLSFLQTSQEFDDYFAGGVLFFVFVHPLTNIGELPAVDEFAELQTRLLDDPAIP